MSLFPSNYLANEILDHTLGVASYTAPSSIYLALYSTNPTASNSGTEVSGGSYARQAITMSAAGSQASTNTAKVTFSSLPTVTATHFGVLDASTSGNLLYYGALPASIVAQSGDNAEFDIGNIDVSVTTG